MTIRKKGKATVIVKANDGNGISDQVLSIKSDDERPWLGLVGVHQGKGNDAEALKLLQDAQKLLPDSVTIGAKIDELNQKPKKKEKPASASPARRRKKSVEK